MNRLQLAAGGGVAAAWIAACSVGLEPPATPQAAPAPATPAPLEIAASEDYRVPAGGMVEGELRVALVARAAGWQPWEDEGPTLTTHVLAVEGQPARVPGPLLRVSAGTPVRVTLRNALADTLLVRGLRDRDQPIPDGVPAGALPALAFVGDSLVLAPGATAEVRFTPTVPGSFFYFGKTVAPGWSATRQPVFGSAAIDRGLAGVLVVDPPGAIPHPDERIFLIGQWADHDVPASWQPAVRFLVNGRSWPHTERLTYAQGDTVRWRVINLSGGFHPMHLHGFYFHVDEWSAQAGGAMEMPLTRPEVVTWPLPSTTAMRMTWVAHEPGNWLFHCHFMRHMSWMQAPPAAGSDEEGGAGHHPHHAPPAAGGQAPEGVDLLGGLVMGITVTPAPGYAPRVEVPRRRLRLHVGMRPHVFGDEPAYAFVLQEGAREPAPDSVRFPGSTLVLTRGEPTEIVVRNHADVPLGVHWHGLELESRADGVPGWSGMPGNVVPAIRPGDSLVVRMTPPRAGTFMYHVHSEPGHQLAQGLYGAFLVMEPGQRWDPESDRLFLLGSLGGGEDAPPAVNGSTSPGPMEFRAGRTYRLRFMHISPEDSKSVRLLEGERPVTWRQIAMDGADLPAAEVRPTPAVRPFLDVGNTLDFLWTPERPGEHTLRILTTFYGGVGIFPRPAPPPHTQDILITVR
jgi:manganese oxidase